MTNKMLIKTRKIQQESMEEGKCWGMITFEASSMKWWTPMINNKRIKKTKYHVRNIVKSTALEMWRKFTDVARSWHAILTSYVTQSRVITHIVGLSLQSAGLLRNLIMICSWYDLL